MALVVLKKYNDINNIIQKHNSLKMSRAGVSNIRPRDQNWSRKTLAPKLL